MEPGEEVAEVGVDAYGEIDVCVAGGDEIPFDFGGKGDFEGYKKAAAS